MSWACSGSWRTQEFWRGSRRTKQCKICSFLVRRLHHEQEPIPRGSEAYAELLLEQYCTGGRPKKGASVLGYFDNPPSFRTWDEVGDYCQVCGMVVWFPSQSAGAQLRVHAQPVGCRVLSDPLVLGTRMLRKRWTKSPSALGNRR
eukprot:SAG25_NODE_2559_length_1534_cov_1.151220_2_plen_144_part_01